jgi:hypothetical protein
MRSFAIFAQNWIKMIVRFNEREIDTEEYDITFEEGCRVDYHEATYNDVMHELDITEDEVDFSLNGGEDGLPESAGDPIDVTMLRWVNHYNDKVLEPYNDKETNILISDTGEDGIQLLYLFHHDLAADSDENDEQFETLDHLFGRMDGKKTSAYSIVESVINEYQHGDLRSEETYVLLKIRFTDKNLEY